MSYTPLPNPSKVTFADLLAKHKAESGVQNVSPNKELEDLGVQGKTTIIPIKDKDGNPVFDSNGKPMYRQVFEATSIPDWYQRAIPVLERREKCWFEGCEQLVTEYQNAVETAKQNGGCSSCKKGAITREYLRKFRAALPPSELNKVAQPTSPPVVVTNNTTKEVKRIPRKPIAYGTIKRIIPEGMQAAFTKLQKERKLMTADSAVVEGAPAVTPTEVPLPDHAAIHQPTRPSPIPGSTGKSDE